MNKHIVLSVLMFYSILVSFTADANTPTSETATKNIMVLSPAMFNILAEQQTNYQHELLQTHPVIVALFSSKGGQFILYRPGAAPMVAPALPQAQDYELSAVIQHTAMTAYEISIQGMNNPHDIKTWQIKMRSLQEKLNVAQNSIVDLNVSVTEKQLFQAILSQANIFITENLEDGKLSTSRTTAYALAIKPNLVQLTKIIATDQVNHWMQVVAGWRELLGKKWQDTYGVVMYIPVHPENNIFLGILTHFMGKDNVDQRLFSFTSDSFTPTPDQALMLLAKATPDQNLANVVFGEYYLAYSSILSATARSVIQTNNMAKASNSLFQ